MFGAILHRNWEAGNKEGTIIHYWAEDGSEANLIVPVQLREELLALQNWLSNKYIQAEQLKIELKEIERFFDVK